MSKKIIKIATLLLALGGQASAGINGITHHSRANCINNETISWDWTRDWLSRISSDHIDINNGTVVHVMETSWQLTWRNAAVHWGEGTGGWTVLGQHWMMNKSNKPVLVAEELVEDCSIYDGWWEKKNKKEEMADE